MTDQQHPITPPQELIEQWIRDANHNESMFAQVAIMGAHWGADQELEACCDVLKNWGSCLSPDLRAARRPKLPSLKEQLIKALDRVPGPGADFAYLCQWSKEESESLINTTRLALEQLDD